MYIVLLPIDKTRFVVVDMDELPENILLANLTEGKVAQLSALNILSQINSKVGFDALTHCKNERLCKWRLFFCRSCQGIE